VPHLKIGIELACLRLPPKKALHVAAQLGADAVEIDARGELNLRQLSQTGLRQLRKMLDDLRLKVAAVTFHTLRGYDALADLGPRIEATKAAMEAAHDLGTSVVVNDIGRIPSDTDSDDWRLLVEVLDELGQYGNRVGATLAAETGSESPEQLARLLAHLPEGALAIDFNPGNLVASGFDPLEALASVGPHIIHVHATDGICDRAASRGKLVSVGQGAVDFPAVLAGLDGHGYDGHFTIQHVGGSDPVAQIGRTIQYLRRM
jgi:sugar phosphate isomerase/epimerase